MSRSLCLLFVAFWAWISVPVCKAQTDEIQQLLLNVEKLDQLRAMLDNMRDKYQIISKGYEKIKGISQGNFELHEAFLDRLVKVNPKVKSYYKVGEIIQLQLRLIRGISKTRQEFRLGDFLMDQEYAQVDRLFEVWSQSSLHLMEELMLILSDNQLQMDDWERIVAIDRVHASVLQLTKGVSSFSNSMAQLGEMRKMKSGEIQTLQLLIDTRLSNDSDE
ncbi:hypothetical protein D0X99_19845 [Algoriphagus lacus]|uniref:TerB family tellurite resistance protein n=1 Tax=Algoriphagus lacus TaxID=2056311 RepID=A0A418PM23_9BACT|nr:hypothetical protein [Algoriphagus lacus]RIW12109.1 hypothetical protein D0X99_19845 [Algoriphagus lacus]